MQHIGYAVGLLLLCDFVYPFEVGRCSVEGDLYGYPKQVLNTVLV